MTATDAPTSSPRRLLLVSAPRTASNLLLKILNVQKQPNLLSNPKGGYFFYPAFATTARSGCLNKNPEEWTEAEKRTVQSAFQMCFDSLEECAAQAQKENKIMFAKEHSFWFYNPASLQKKLTGRYDAELSKAFRTRIPDAYGPTNTFSPSNETILPDEYLRTWQMAFIIRHPALAWPSLYRAMTKLIADGFMAPDGIKGAALTNMTLRWPRMLYDWYMEQPDVPMPPTVVDAHDLIHNPEIVLKFCEQTGLDKSVVQFEWDGENAEKKSNQWAPAPDADPDAEDHDVHRRAAIIMLSSLEGSSGVLKDRAPATIDIPAEVAKWKVEFGEETAQFLEKTVWDSMPDYEYLKARRLTV